MPACLSDERSYEQTAVVSEDRYVQSLPARRQDVAALVVRLAPEYDVDPRLARAIAGVESNFDRLAQSPKNARGVMQLIPETAARFNVRNPSMQRTTSAAGWPTCAG
jgi:soluble lytic murein transglycosylase-like protein